MELPTTLVRENMGESSWLDSTILPQSLMAGEDQFRQLWNLHPSEHAEVVLYGKSIPIPRWQRSYGRDYKFSGTVSKGFPIPDLLAPYIDWSNSLYPGITFNEILLNWYQDGSHYIGSHADDEKQLISGSPIITITLCLSGEPRKFRIRNIEKTIVKDIFTHNGTVLIMGGNFQKEFKHEIVKMTGSSAEKAGSRISITLRQFK
jgi:alkylated DNA repair dioxygenase AlkB